MDYVEHPEDKIDDFEVFEILGRGGFARVYRARSKITGQEVAIKIIDKKMAQENKMIERVSKEVELHRRLKHPNILELYGFFEDSKYVYIVLELCHNGNLYRKVQEKGALSEEESRRYMHQIISGVKYLHKYSILHRDLTLANILMSSDDTIKICDFGLATQLHNQQAHYTMCGTPNFISPEIVNREHQQTLQSDVWSVGCCLYTMLVGRTPFGSADGDVKNTLSRVVHGTWEITGLGDNARNLIGGILQKHPDCRMTLSEILAHPFMRSKNYNKQCKNVSNADSGIVSGLTTRHALTSSVSSSSSFNCKSSLTEVINTVRLRPVRQRTQNLILNLLPDGSTVVEFLVSTGSAQVPSEVMQIDSSGLNILLFYPQSFSSNKDKVTVIQPTDKSLRFTLESLPRKYIKKYQIAYKFVQLIRSNTAKITWYTDGAKVQMMENHPQPNYEICFQKKHSHMELPYPASSNVQRSITKMMYDAKTLSTTCRYSDGYISVHHDDTNNTTSTSQLVESLNYFAECRAQLSRLHDLISQQTTLENFICPWPMILGRLNSDSPSIIQSQSSSQINSSLTDLSLAKSLPDLAILNDYQGFPVFIPKIGWVNHIKPTVNCTESSQLSILFNDGAQLTIDYSNSSSTLLKWLPHHTNYWQQFNTHQEWPKALSDKIKQLPQILIHIQSSSTLSCSSMSSLR